MKWTFRTVPALILISALVFASCITARTLTINDIEALNPEFAELEFHSITPPLSFSADRNSDELVTIRAVFYSGSIQWQPWFDQPRGEPDQILGDGRLYSQHIYLAHPVAEPVRSLVDYWPEDFGSRPPLNFYALREINPALNHYEILPTPITSDGSVVFFAPAQSGIAFIGDIEGDIYSIMQIGPGMVGFRPGDLSRDLHPDLGEISYYNVYLRDPAGRFCLDGWFNEHWLKSLVTSPGDRIGDGFIVGEVDLKEGFFPGMIDISVEITNNTGYNYTMPSFSIIFYDSGGVKLGESMLAALGGIKDGESTTLSSMAFLERYVDLEEMIYSIDAGQFIF